MSAVSTGGRFGFDLVDHVDEHRTACRAAATVGDLVLEREQCVGAGPTVMANARRRDGDVEPGGQRFDDRQRQVVTVGIDVVDEHR